MMAYVAILQGFNAGLMIGLFFHTGRPLWLIAASLFALASVLAVRSQQLNHKSPHKEGR